MTAEGFSRGWPFQGQPINVDFDVNWDSEQSRGLVAWWPMIGSQGGWPVPDRAFHRYPMAPFNTPTWASDEQGWSVLFFDLANEYLEIDSAVVSGTPFTLSAWFNSDDAAPSQVLVSLGDKDAGDEYSQLYLSAQKVAAVSRSAAGGAAQAATTPTWALNTWTHGCGVWASATSRAAYLNGANKATNANNITSINLDRTCIGRRARDTGGQNMSGRIRDARIYNRALTDTEVYNLYARPWELYAPRIYRPMVYAAAVPSVGPFLTTYGGYSTPVG